MKLEIYQDEKKEPKKPILLKLAQDCENLITLTVCDSAGIRISGGNLLTISIEGVVRCSGLKDLGFDRDSTPRRIKDISRCLN